jgi:hypothetical protein
MKKALDHLHIYCPTKLRIKLMQLAEANHRSMSAEVQMMIEEAYKRRFPSLIERKEDE